MNKKQWEQRTKQEFELHAKEDVDVQILSGRAYGFTSELGALRLFYTYRDAVDVEQTLGYSQNRQSWYFSMNMIGYELD